MRPARLLRWYPRAWRERYGEELLALILDTADEGRPAWRLRFGVAWGGLRERGHQAVRAGRAAVKPVTVDGRWVILSAGLLFAYLPYNLTKPLHPARGWPAAAAFDGVLAVVALTGAVVLAAGLAAMPALVRFLRAGGWPKIRRRVALAAGSTVVAGTGLVGVAVLTRLYSREQVSLPVGIALIAAFLAAGLAAAVAIGLWAIAAAATALHLTLGARLRSAQLMLGAVIPSAVSVTWGALNIWWAVTQSPVWLIAGLVMLGGAAVTARGRLRAAARTGRRLRAAARAGATINPSVQES